MVELDARNVQKQVARTDHVFVNLWVFKEKGTELFFLYLKQRLVVLSVYTSQFTSLHLFRQILIYHDTMLNIDW